MAFDCAAPLAHRLMTSPSWAGWKETSWRWSSTSARQGIAEGEEPAEASPGANGFGRPGYMGPAPPPGDDPHRYIFRLFAVDEPVALTGLPSYQDVDTAVTGHILGEARLIGTYQR